MLTYNELVDLEHSLGEQIVLSVYINGEEKDPAKRKRWRIDLRNSLDEIEPKLAGASHDEREGFRTSREKAQNQLASIRGLIKAPGWAGFFTNHTVHYFGPVPAPVPTVAMWTKGPCLTPYIRALKEARPVIVIVADSRKARIFKYVERKAELLETLRAEVHVEPPYHMSKPPRQGFHLGQRGPTGADAVQKDIREGTAHMLAEVAEKVAKRAGMDAWVVAGGIPNIALALLDQLPNELTGRTVHADGLDVHATKAGVADAAREYASRLRDRVDLERVREAIEGAASDGLGSLGSVPTLRALEQGRARDVYFTLAFLQKRPEDAESAVRLALASRAQVEHVSGEAAAQLDERGGIAARLRYALPPAVAAQAVANPSRREGYPPPPP